jgi:GTP pyrophosphokinase
MTNDTDAQGVPLPAQPWAYSERLIQAMKVAAQIHAAQIRTDTTIPYLSHLLGTCSIAMEYGATEDEAIAALLHDAIEDGEPVAAARATVRTFGDDVARIVEGCTDTDTHPKPPWPERKRAYLARLAAEDRSVLLVSASDKLHNARSIVRDIRGVGAEVWTRFSVPKEDTLWYYRTLVTTYRANPEHNPALVDELDRTVTEMESLATVDRAEVGSHR